MLIAMNQRRRPPNPPASQTTSTLAVHAGERRFRTHHSLTVPIVQTAVYTFDNTQDLIEFSEERMFWDEPEREEYGRYGNPTVRAVEAKLAALDGAQDAILVSSGMAAVTSTLLMLLGAGQHFILTDNCYHSTLAFSRDFLKRYGVECTVVPCGDYDCAGRGDSSQYAPHLLRVAHQPVHALRGLSAPGGDRPSP